MAIFFFRPHRCNMAFIEPMHRNKPSITYMFRSQVDKILLVLLSRNMGNIEFLLEDLTGLILGLRPANERCHYKVTPSLIGRAQT